MAASRQSPIPRARCRVTNPEGRAILPAGSFLSRAGRRTSHNVNNLVELVQKKHFDTNSRIQGTGPAGWLYVSREHSTGSPTVPQSQGRVGLVGRHLAFGPLWPVAVAGGRLSPAAQKVVLFSTNRLMHVRADGPTVGRPRMVTAWGSCL